jgi:hypothetical protein
MLNRTALGLESAVIAGYAKWGMFGDKYPSPPKELAAVVPFCACGDTGPVLTSSDPLNCGRCGYACPSGACQAGACVPEYCEPKHVKSDGTCDLFRVSIEPTARAKDSVIADVSLAVTPNIQYELSFDGGVIPNCGSPDLRVGADHGDLKTG